MNNNSPLKFERQLITRVSLAIIKHKNRWNSNNDCIIITRVNLYSIPLVNRLL